MAQGINTPVVRGLKRYAERLGIAPGDLRLASQAVESPIVPSGTSAFYQQYFHDVPVHGRGYFVHQANGSLRMALGRLANSLSLDVTPTVSEMAARGSAATALSVDAATALTRPPTLEIYPTGDTAERLDVRLVWRFEVDGGPTVPQVARVDAKTGKVFPGESRLVDFLGPDARYVGQAQQNVTTVYNGGQDISIASYLDGPGTTFVLSSGPIDAADSVGLVDYTGLASSREFDPGLWPYEWPTSDAGWVGAAEARRATAYWAAGVSRAFSDSLELLFNGTPWQGSDGIGLAPTRIWYDTTTRFLSKDGGANAYFYGDADSLTQTNIVIAPNDSEAPVNLHVLAHEYFHAIVKNGRGRSNLQMLGQRREVGSINEGLSDVFGAAAVHAMLPEDLPWSCLRLGTSCLRDIAIPSNTKNPDHFGVPPYVDYSALLVGIRNRGYSVKFTGENRA